MADSPDPSSPSAVIPESSGQGGPSSASGGGSPASVLVKGLAYEGGGVAPSEGQGTEESGGMPPLATGKTRFIAGLPASCLVYGIGAGALFAACIRLALRGHWISVLLVLLPAGCLVGFSILSLKRKID